jgi:hypothetical protein
LLIANVKLQIEEAAGRVPPVLDGNGLLGNTAALGISIQPNHISAISSCAMAARMP